MKQVKKSLAVLLVGMSALAVGCGSSANVTESPAASTEASESATADTASESPAASTEATTSESPAA